MHLYYFTSQKYGLRALRKKQLKISRLNELNDPFEFLCWRFSNAFQRTKLANWKNDQNQKLGIVCFSRKWSHPLLWGHYADKHRGLVLGFEVQNNDDTYLPIKYRKTRLPFPNRSLVDKDVEAIILTKFESWNYENEYRCFSILKDSHREGGFYFEKFSEKLKLVEVILGERSKLTFAQLDKKLKKYNGVRKIKARLSTREYAVVRDATWK